MLLLSLKTLGEYLCPRCNITKPLVPDIGTINDMKRRKNIRVDNDLRRLVVNNARVRIFRQGMAVNSVKVQRLLNKGSLTATRVGLLK